MNRLFCSIIAVFMFLAFVLPGISFAKNGNDIKLPEVSESSGMDYFDALRNRASIRAFSEKELSMQDLGDVLWTAGGRKSLGGKWVIPYAMRTDPTCRIFVTCAFGTYLYDGTAHSLKFVNSSDLRAEVAVQEFVGEAPVVLIFVANPAPLESKAKGKGRDEALDTVYLSAGAIMQDVYLAASAKSLATCYIGNIRHGEWEKGLGLSEGEIYFGSMPVGYMAE